MVGDRENTSAGLVTSYEIETLEPNTMYNIYVHAVNSIGTGQPVMITTLTDSLSKCTQYVSIYVHTCIQQNSDDTYLQGK